MSKRTIGLALLLIAAPAAAQCLVGGITFTEYGAGCSGFGQDPPGLTGSYSAASCSVTFAISGWAGNCPSTCITSRVLAFGVATAQVPLPFVPCDLLVVPDLTFVFPASAGASLTFNISGAALAGLTIYVQGAKVFQTPSSVEYEVTNGLQMTLS